MRVLGIESTCDETAAAVVDDRLIVHSNVIASQAELHAKFRGVVPEIASRAHIEQIMPVISEALAGAKTTLEAIDGIAVAHRPGLIGSLLIGVTAAKTLAWATGKPLIGVDHVQAHLHSVCLIPLSPGDGAEGVRFPALGLVASGGHTALYSIQSWTDISLIGSTIDDAIGEAYDKVAAILGLGYPGGPIIDRLATSGDPNAINLPRPTLGRESLDFSFSGLKTAVLYAVRGVPGKDETPPPLTEQRIADVAASFQAACMDVIAKKLKRGIEKTGAKSIVIGGGVSANRALRERVKSLGLPVFVPQLPYCTDNAAMIAGLGSVLLRHGQRSTLDLDAITFSRFVA